MARNGRNSLAFLCYDLAGGDPERALLLAVDTIRLFEQGMTPRSRLLTDALETLLAYPNRPAPPLPHSLTPARTR